jgi:hypothetical protein
MKPGTALALAAYGAGAWASVKYADEYWVVGPVFGAVVLFFARKALRKNAAGAASYFAASVLIYALVRFIADLGWGDGRAFFEYVAGPFPVAIVAGSLLLPLAHRAFLKADARAAFRTSATLVGTFYLVTLLGYVNEELGVGPHVAWLPVLVAVWQGTYLAGFFRKTA